MEAIGVGGGSRNQTTASLQEMELTKCPPGEALQSLAMLKKDGGFAYVVLPSVFELFPTMRKVFI